MNETKKEQIKVELKAVTSTKKEAAITVCLEDVESVYKASLNKIRKTAKVKGFRPGKVPDDVLIKTYGPQIDYETINPLVDVGLKSLIEEHKVAPLGKPAIDVGDFDSAKPFTFKAIFDVLPEIKLKNYKRVTIKKIKVEASEEELERELNNLREQHATLKAADKEASIQDGLVVKLDFEGFLDSKLFDGGKAENYSLEVGKGAFIKDFEKGIIGMKMGQEGEIAVKFPDDYPHEILKGKDATFKIKINEIHKKIVPGLDDDFAKDLSKGSLKELKDEVSAKIVEAKEHSNRFDYEKQALEYLVSKHKFDIPETMLQQEMESAKKSKQSEEDVMFRLRSALLLDAIAKAEKIEVTKEDMDAKFNEIAQQQRQPVESIRQFYASQNLTGYLAHQISSEKTLDFVLSNAKMK